MGKAGETLTVSVDETGLRLTVERLLQQSEGRPVRIATLTREPSPFASLFPAEVLSLTLQSGDKRSLFVKYLGSEQADHPDKQCRDREIRIYEELLAGGGAQRGAGPRGLRVSAAVERRPARPSPIAHHPSLVQSLGRRPFGLSRRTLPAALPSSPPASAI